MVMMRSLPSVMRHQFSNVPSAEIQRSSFDRSHGVKTTFDAGYLVPIFVDEALPGDTLNCRLTSFGRLATPLRPIMDNLHVDTFFFAVPLRLIWDNWQKFCGEQIDPGDSTDYLVPQMTSPVGGYANQSLSDYFGLPTQVAGVAHSSLWHRAYNLIYNEWFRDQNLQDSVVVDRDDGPDDPADYVLLKRGKRHDYFTSCLPWPQKGPSVELPLGTSAPVYGDGNVLGLTNGTTSGGLLNNSGVNVWTGAYGLPLGGLHNTGTSLNAKDLGVVTSGVSGLVADLSEATAATINSLRQAFAVQRLYERDARGGTRYTEILRSHFGVVSPDARLQRPEYLGGGFSPININPIAQTSQPASGQPLGQLAAMGTMSFSGHGFAKSFTEHCVVIGLACVRADLNYQQGLNRMFSRRTRWDFYWPALSHIGEQAVLNKEIFAQGTADDSNVFGYQERFAEYRYKPSMVTGKFRSNDPQSLDTWHLSQDFASLPVLNASFIVENPPIDRIVAVPSEPDVLMDCFFQYRCARPMPTYSVPGLIDHF